MKGKITNPESIKLKRHWEASSSQEIWNYETQPMIHMINGKPFTFWEIILRGIDSLENQASIIIEKQGREEGFWNGNCAIGPQMKFSW